LTLVSDDDLVRLVVGGREILAADAATLEDQLKAQPDNISLRARLLGFWSNEDCAGGSYAGHVLWFIKNAPRSEVVEAGLLQIYDGPESVLVAQCSALWHEHLTGSPGDTSILANAAKFFLHFDPARSDPY
jgi:hypothetical protein